MTTKNIKDLFQQVHVALNPIGLCSQYVFAPYRGDNSASFNYDYPLIFVDSEIFVTKIGQDPKKIPLHAYDVALYWLDVPNKAGQTGAGSHRVEIDENVKPRIELVWSALWGVLVENLGSRTIWADDADGYTLAPIEYENGDGVCGYRIEFRLYAVPVTQACDFTNLAGKLVKLCQTQNL